MRILLFPNALCFLASLFLVFCHLNYCSEKSSGIFIHYKERVFSSQKVFIDDRNLLKHYVILTLKDIIKSLTIYVQFQMSNVKMLQVMSLSLKITEIHCLSISCCAERNSVLRINLIWTRPIKRGFEFDGFVLEMVHVIEI